MTTNQTLKRVNNEYSRKLEKKNFESEQLVNYKFMIKELKE